MWNILTMGCQLTSSVAMDPVTLVFTPSSSYIITAANVPAILMHSTDYQINDVASLTCYMFLYSPACLQRSHLSHLKYPFSSSGPFTGNLFGRVGFIISAIFLSLLLQGITEPSGKTFSQIGSEYRIFLNS